MGEFSEKQKLESRKRKTSQPLGHLSSGKNIAVRFFSSVYRSSVTVFAGRLNPAFSLFESDPL
jgi:hypothetical protein